MSFIGTITAFLPLATLIGLALATKNMMAAMTCGLLLAMILLHPASLVTGTISSFYETLSNDSFQFILVMLALFGGFVEILHRSGALQGFGRYVSRLAKGPKKLMVLAWVMSLALSVDEYLNSVTVSVSLRELTDQSRIPREHLALQTQAMACSLCAAVPFTSWIGFSLSLLKDYGLGFQDYLRSIPFMFFPLLMILISLLLAAGIMPKLGNLRRAYERIDEGGPALQEEAAGGQTEIGGADVEAVSAAYALIPLAVLVVGVLYFDSDLVSGLLLGLACQFILYIPRGLMKVGEFFEAFLSGSKGMTSIILIIFLGFTLSSANRDLGFFDIITGSVDASVSPIFLPILAFLMNAFCVFAIGSCWVVMLITFPVFLPLAAECGASPILILASLMSGICLGYCLSFYSDTIFVNEASSQVPAATTVRTMLPYAAFAAVLSCGGFAVCGLAI